MSWIAIKLELASLTGLEKDALHVYGAVLLQLAAALITRRTLADVLPWVTVAAAAAVNEWADLTFSIWPDRSWQYAESVHDLVNTMALPTLLLVLARVRPRLFARRSPAPSEAPSD